MTSCQKCPFDTNTCPGWGYEDSDLVFVGQAPARTEVKQQKPFVGKSGQLLRATLQQVGLDLDNYYTTNSVLCRLPDGEDTPYAVCRDRLVQEIDEVDPQLIVCLGADAWKSVYATESGVVNNRGRFYWSSRFKATVLPTLHPAACLYEGTAVSSAFRDFKKDLKAVADRQIAGGFTFEDIKLPKTEDLDHETPRIQNTVIKTPEQAKNFYRYCVDANSVDVVAADIESTGFNPRTEDLLCIGFCFQHGQTAVLTPDAIQQDVLGYFLTNTDLQFVWHNGKFDAKFLRQKGIEAEVHQDTMLLSYLLDERSGVHSLSYLAGQHFNAPDWEQDLKEYMEDDGDYASIPGEVLYDYNSLDVHYTYRLYQTLHEELSDSLSEAYEEVLIPASNNLPDVELEGLLLDTEHLSEVDEQLSGEIKEIRSELVQYAQEYGWSTERYVEESGAKSEPDQINFNSPQQMWFLFFDCLGFPRYRGNDTIEAEARNWMRSVTDDEEKLEFMDLYDEYQEKRTLYDRYVSGLPEYQEDDGRVRSDLALHRTVTGRLSCLPDTEKVEAVDKGLISIKDVEEGDRVRTPSGEYKTVQKHVCTGENTIYKVELSDGRTIRCTGNHMFLSGGIQWKELKKLNEGDDILLSFNGRPGGSLENEENLEYKTEKWAEFIGFLIAEGSMDYSNEERPYTLVVAAHKRERELLEKYKYLIKSYLGYEGYVEASSTGKSTRLRVHNVEFNQHLQNEILGEPLGKSDKRSIPDWIMCSSGSLSSAFLRGYFQGDGSVTKNDCRVSAKTVSRTLVNQVQTLLGSHGIYSNIHARSLPSDNHNKCYTISIPKRCNYRFSTRIGFISDRKQEIISGYAGDKKAIDNRYDLNKILRNEQDIISILPQRSHSDEQKKWIELLHQHMSKNRKYKSKSIGYDTVKKLYNWMNYNDYIKIPEAVEYIVKNTPRVVEITSIKKENKKQTTYELSVEGGVYTTNNVICHNSSEPNLQNIARDTEIKNAFVAPEGHVLLEADYSQLEVCLMAQFSGDEFLQSVYKEGGDLHDRMAERLFGEDFTKEERVVAKTVNFGVAYGIQAEGLSSRTHLGEDEAEQIIDRWFKMAPGVEEYFKQIKERVDQQGYVESWFGRRRRFPLKTRQNKHSIYKEACNFVIQSPGSDITTLSAVELNKRYKVVMLVHDSVLIEAPEDSWREIGRDCLQVMPRIAEESLDADIPFDVDVEVGKRWGELEEVELLTNSV